MKLAKIFDKSAPESSILQKLNFSYNSTLLHYAELNTNHPTIAQLLYKDTYDSLGNYISEHREGIKHSLSLSYTDNIFKYFDFTQSLNYNEIWDNGESGVDCGGPCPPCPEPEPEPEPQMNATNATSFTNNYVGLFKVFWDFFVNLIPL